MSVVFTELGGKTLLRIEIDGCATLSVQLVEQLDSALRQAEDMASNAVLFIHVAGGGSRAACPVWPGSPKTQMVISWERVLRRIERANLPVMTFVQRVCSMMALELLLLADCRFASHDLSLKQSSNCIWPGTALYRLSRQIGESRACKLLLDIDPLTASRAAQLDIVDKTVNDLTEALSQAKHLLTRAPLSDFAVRRRLIQDSGSMSFDEALGAHLAACDRMLRQPVANQEQLATVAANNGILSA
jgi:isomerase DpgB